MSELSSIERGELVRDKMMKGIVSYIEEHQYPPTVREIGNMVGLQSTSSVQSHIRKLIDEGRLETDTEDYILPRAIRVPGYRFVKESEARHG